MAAKGAQAGASIQVKDGVLSTDPGDFAHAIEALRRDKLKGLWIRPDFRDKEPKAPVVDLALLKEVASLDDFGIADFSLKRITNFDAIYGLTKLRKLAMHTFKTLDLSRFPKLETLFVTDAPGLTGLDALTELRYARLTKLRAEDLSFVGEMPRLAELWIIQAPGKRFKGLDTSRSLATLDVSHCSKVDTISALPKSLTKLKIKKCAQLKDLAFVKGHAALEFLYVDVMTDVAFVPSLRSLTYLGFENVVDGDLEPILESRSLKDVGFFPAKRKHYTRSESEIKELLAARKR
jgi:internalin A